ncbi:MULTISPECIES: MauE/DoxX family redox-associated membrane protein [Pseudodesulfovibrio]|uniref:Methylamine utilization MauE n=1 Tax=Pseudodesulfovibrio aespoeensis (strain ATCC 700646 / DSM 10631 / Aspo-2) TaxID=643562 RepID=E6VXS2_PSEA9|nr:MULTISPECIES: MauE/DoxX family redox-associated membrane protein [Pseudodesulfovibrio]ADU61530.1 methylamine utilization MauE [Pseudodesulfovibrio aespoeensis Aspo-2]MCG2733706.1 DoxX family membrane protein [Pseudodesulfovibrio aespoeensis]
MTPLAPVALILRLALGAVFLYASWDKLLNPADFAAIVRDYRMVPDWSSNVVAVWLPWLEAVLGLLLLAGVWRWGSLLLANLLLPAFWGMLFFNYLRGIDVGCGCFSTTPGESGDMEWFLLRDGLLVLLGLAAALAQWKQRAASRA